MVNFYLLNYEKNFGKLQSQSSFFFVFAHLFNHKYIERKVNFMAREFATSEVIRQKCSICGSKNKLYTEIQYKGIHYGYMLTCCNCGHVDIFMDSLNGPSGLFDNDKFRLCET